MLPNSRISPGYVRGEDGVLVVERPKARTVVQAFKRRDRGASLVEIQAWLAENRIERSISGVASMLRSRMYLGEIHFGELHDTRAHEPIIKDRALFERVQRRTVSRGRQAKSERLLARLGVLRCGTCASRMVINSYSGNYRCGDTSAKRCQRRAAVKADRVEEMVLDAVRAYSATADRHRCASRKQQIREADEAIERANADLDEAIRQLGELGLLGRPASQETLGKLTKALDDAHTARPRLVMEGGLVAASEEGTPQGSPLSPLLSNVMLDDLDWELERRGHRFVRFADDGRICVRSRRAGERVMASITQYVEQRLKLRVSREKSVVDRATKRPFLGFGFRYRGGEVKVSVVPKSQNRAKGRLRELTSRRWGVSMERRIFEINRFTVGRRHAGGIPQSRATIQAVVRACDAGLALDCRLTRETRLSGPRHGTCEVKTEMTPESESPPTPVRAPRFRELPPPTLGSVIVWRRDLERAGFCVAR